MFPLDKTEHPHIATRILQLASSHHSKADQAHRIVWDKEDGELGDTVKCAEKGHCLLGTPFVG